MPFPNLPFRQSIGSLFQKARQGLGDVFAPRLVSSSYFPGGMVEPGRNIPPEPLAFEPRLTPGPTPRPALPPPGSGQYYDLVKKYFPEEEWEHASRIMEGESGVDPMTKPPANEDGTIDYGLFQINSVHADMLKNLYGYEMEDMLDPEKNVKVAADLQRAQGWQPWKCPYARQLW